MGSQLQRNLCTRGKFGMFKFTISYRKYTLISKQINLLCTVLYSSWSWCGCLHGYYVRNGVLWKHRIMGAKIKQVTLWNQASKWKLVWSSKEWSIKEGLTPISCWPLCIIQKRLSCFNLCWLLNNSIIQARDNHFIDIITQ